MATAEGEEITSNASSDQIVFYLRPAGSAPILRRKKWVVPRSKTFASLSAFLIKHMQLNPEEQKHIFLYVNQAFAPSLDTTIGAVHDCFHTEGNLVLNYSLMPAWG